MIRNTVGSGDASDKMTKDSSLIKFEFAGTPLGFSSSFDKSQVVVAGREVLKILKVGQNDITEVRSLRAGMTGLRLNNNLSFSDVSWGKGGDFTSKLLTRAMKNIIASASMNGSILFWNLELNSQTKLEKIVTEHNRAVNKVAFSPFECELLISGSIDGTIKLWNAKSHSTLATFAGKAESARDIKWSPTKSNLFVGAFENGNIQIWDVNQSKSFLRKWNAHNGLALTVDWFQDGNLIASGGRDRIIKIWDIRSDKKSVVSIQAMQTVADVHWRPSEPLQVASFSLSNDPNIYVWDLRRPYVAQMVIDIHENPIVASYWVDQNTLWSCSKDGQQGVFAKHDIRHSFCPIDLLNPSCTTWSVDNDMSFAVDQGEAAKLEKAMMSASYVKHKSILERRPFPFFEQASAEPAVPDVLVPFQATGTFECGSFDPDVFVELACSYSFDSTDIHKSFSNNEKVSLSLNHWEAVRAWRLCKILFDESYPLSMDISLGIKEIIPPRPSPIESVGNWPVSSTTNPPSALTPTSIPEQDQTMPIPLLDSKSLAFILGAEELENETDSETSSVAEQFPIFNRLTKIDTITSKPSKLSVVPAISILEPESTQSFHLDFIDRKKLILSIIDVFAEQTAASIVLILGKRMEIEAEKKEQLLWAYLEFLQRFELWVEATALINSSECQSLMEMNQESTTMYTTCGNCGKNHTTKEEWTMQICFKCKSSLASCSLCHKAVSKSEMFMWCQGCAHGGHMTCMNEWFTVHKHTQCPAGCGHVCNF